MFRCLLGGAGLASRSLTRSALQRNISSVSRLHLPASSRLFTPALRLLHGTPYYGITPSGYRHYGGPDSRTMDHQEPDDTLQTGTPNDSQEIIKTFAELGERGLVSGTIIDTITKTMGLETMTVVQSMTINETLKGIDVVAQARTGTGKTLAFLIPIIERILSAQPSMEQRTNTRGQSVRPDIRAIIISPTRELAEQIAVEARKVVRNTGLVVQTAVGGNAKAQGLATIRRQGCHILVGTPGRLKDILQDPYSGIETPNLNALVLDEADRLLDQGFSEEIQAIAALLPDRKVADRQTLMFSATMPREVMGMVERVIKPSYKFVQTIQPGEADTHLKVPQMLVKLAGLENQLPALLELAKRHLTVTEAPRPFKAIVFYGATSEAELAKETFTNLVAEGGDRFAENLLHPAVLVDIHGKLTQAARTRHAESFRRAKTGILFASDVAARGMDFPNVTHVIQIGLPSSRDVYVHRLGRTARGQQEGEGWLFLTPPEITEAQIRLRRLPLQPDTSLATAMVNMTQDAQLPVSVAETLQQIAVASKRVAFPPKAAAYRATLGLYAFIRNKQQLVDLMNRRSQYGWNLELPPTISSTLATKLGMRQTTGLNLARSEDSGSRPPRSFGRRGDSAPSRYGQRGGSGFSNDADGGSSGRGRFGSSSSGSRSNFGSRDSSRGGGFARSRDDRASGGRPAYNRE